jgi:hypothetical protein
MIYLRQDLFNPVSKESQRSNIVSVGQLQTDWKPSQPSDADLLFMLLTRRYRFYLKSLLYDKIQVTILPTDSMMG